MRDPQDDQLSKYDGDSSDNDSDGFAVEEDAGIHDMQSEELGFLFASFSFFSMKRKMPILFFMNCERTVLFSVKHHLDPPLPPSRHAMHTFCTFSCQLLKFLSTKNNYK